MKIIIDIPEARYKDIQRIASVQLENYHFKTAEQIIAEGVALETKTQYQIIHQIEALYAKATALGYIQKPLAWALYQVWKDVDKEESEDKLDGDPVDIDKAVEHYEGTLETLKGIDLEVNE